MKRRHYFIALLPDAKIQEQVTRLKQYCCDRYQSQAALRSPPHVTLYPPFWWPDAGVGDLEQALEAFSHQAAPVELILDGFAAFPPRVIYIHVAPTPALKTLQADLVKAVAQPLNLPPTQRHPFTPHMTIAFRDLTKENFHHAWADFQEQSFAARCWVSHLTLLVHNGRRWQIHREFLLRNLAHDCP
ncbi:2'-5' RNA ligase family protein [uncultured Thermosynechococcus sp.]|uniref:2'-5' RNA ligase family protein n=2 Tax=uncultured Thermosynechococcus sp. TaxID=436945 RepID=UPI00262EFCBD|nr:2'-5' RNA ligase family protein [uncultured Thermosynechococcus sp.]